MVSKYEAAHFDMDGVLVDSEQIHVAAEQQTCMDHNFEIDPEQWDGFKGRTAEDIFSFLIQTYGDPQKHDVDSLIDYKTDVFISLIAPQLQPIVGSMEFLTWSRRNFQVLSLVTSSNRRIQQFITRNLGIDKIFDAIVTGDDITTGKPSPEPYLTAMGRLGVIGKQSIVFEDSLSGIESGLAAGCDVMALTTSHRWEELVVANPTYIAGNFPAARDKLTMTHV